MNLYREAGELLLGSRLKRIGDRFLTEIARVYRLSKIDFDPAWFPAFFLLDKEETVTISGFAEELLISQSGATQLIKGLEKKGLLEEFQAEGRDRRTKSVRFTDEGKFLLEKVRPVWEALAVSMNALLAEGLESSHFLQALSELEEEFDTLPLGDRVLGELRRQNLLEELSLNSWCPDDDESFRKLLFQWLSDSPKPAAVETENILRFPESCSSGERLLLLRSKEAVIGFAICRRLPETEISALYIHPDWQRCGAEELFISLLEDTACKDTPLTLILHRGQTSLLISAKKYAYTLLRWEDDFIILRRNQ